MRLRIGLAIVVGAVLVVWLFPRHPPTDEERIRAAIAQMANDAEGRDVSALLSHLSTGYRGEGGSKDELHSELMGYLLGATRSVSPCGTWT